jgi:hypothetical protein
MSPRLAHAAMSPRHAHAALLGVLLVLTGPVHAQGVRELAFAWATPRPKSQFSRVTRS